MGEMTIAQVASTTEEIQHEIEKVIVGKGKEIRLLLAALLAGGHVLLEDVPGTGKTSLAKALAGCFSCEFGRVQFTPDLLPSELTGIFFYSPKTGEFSFRKGSMFKNILLADEINRATPRTQSGLLESMEESQVTVDGQTFPLPSPYFVIATQNPVETQGTFPLPEAQLDRFLIKLGLSYPTKEETVGLLGRGAQPPYITKPVCDKETLFAMRQTVKEVDIHSDVCRYIVDLAEATRTFDGVQLGVSTRGAMALSTLAKAACAIDGRAYCTPDDVKRLVPYVFGHRIIFRGGRRGASSADILSSILASVDVPVEDWSSLSKDR